MKLQSKLIGLLMLIFSVNLSAQITQGDLLKAWDKMTAMVVETAEAMPSEYYIFKPAEGLRDFASQITHTANGNYILARVFKLENPKIKITSKDKKEIIPAIKKSFLFIRKGIKEFTKEDLSEKIDFADQKIARFKVILMLTAHLQREQGKTIIYTRLKNIAPGRSDSW